jgi:hypothetical protein
MKRTDSLCIVSSHRVSDRWLAWCCRACRNAFAPRFTLQPTQPSCVQLSCLERELLAVAAVFAGGLAANSTAAPDHRRLEPTRLAKAEGKTKGGGTRRVATPVCTWGRSGTLQCLRRAVDGVQRASRLAYQRASHARPRPGLPRTQ